jgi:hypothetical protein
MRAAKTPIATVAQKAKRLARNSKTGAGQPRYSPSANTWTSKMHNDDHDWKAVEAALERVRRLPAGPERIEALRRVGKIRFAADRRRYQKEQRDNGGASKGRKDND